MPEPAFTEVDTMGDDDDNGTLYGIQIRWQGKTLLVDGLTKSDTVYSLKLRLNQLTRVPINKQKLLGLVKSRLPDDNTPLSKVLQPTDFVAREISELATVSRPQPRIMLIGTSLEDLPATAVETPIFQDEDECVGDDGDEDDEFEGQTGANYQSGDRTDYLNHEYQAVIEKFTSQLTINFITNPRPGKKLLVLDLDYTLYDPKRRSQRPFMHEFLKAVYRHFDLAIWSQTSWSRLEAKISDIGLLTHPFYRIAFVLDVSSMFSIQRQRSNGTVTQHQVKCLELIWQKLNKYYTPETTLHVDDLKRNFCLNPTNGIRIESYRADRAHSQLDDRLLWLAGYLSHVATVSDLRSIDHRHWSDHVRNHLKQQRQQEQDKSSKRNKIDKE